MRLGWHRRVDGQTGQVQHCLAPRRRESCHGKFLALLRKVAITPTYLCPTVENSALVSVGWNQDEQPFLLQLEKDVGKDGPHRGHVNGRC